VGEVQKLNGTNPLYAIVITLQHWRIPALEETRT